MDFSLTGPFLSAALQFLGIVLIPLALGFAFTSRLRGPYFVGEKLLIGLALGIVALTFLCFLLSLFFGFHPAIVYVVFILGLVVAAWRFWSGRASGFEVRPRVDVLGASRGCGSVDLYGVLVFVLSLGFFWLFGTMIITWKDGALGTGIIDNYGDLPFHLGVITGFLNGGSLPPVNHTFAGHQLTYPFLSDFFSAMLVRTGIPLEHAIELPCILLNSVAMTLLFYVGYRLVRHSAAAALAPGLFVLAGGLGFLWFLSDIYLANKPVWEMITHLPRRYTSLGDDGIHWINPTLAHLIPQRSLLFGFPLALSLIILWWTEKDKEGGNAWFPGILAGLLPLSHTHAFLVMMMVSAMFALRTLARRKDRKSGIRYWGTFYAIAMVLALPQVVYILSSRVTVGGFMRLETGWMAGEENIVWFWLKNTGFMIPLLLAGLLFHRSAGIRMRAVWFYVPFGLLLIIGNIFLFAPLSYDTNKILVFGFLLAIPFIARVLIALFKAKSWWVHGPLFRLLFLSLVLSGGLNLIHELQGGGWEEITAEEIELARVVGSQTRSESVFVMAPIHNSFLTLAGRGVVLGYPGHVISHGLDHRPAEEAIQEIFSGSEKAREKLREYRVNYIVVGPHERSKYGGSVDWLQGQFPEAFRTQNYVIYKCG